MANDVGVDQVQGFFDFASAVVGLRQDLLQVGDQQRTPLDLLPAGAGGPLADVAGAVANLRRQNEAAVVRLARYVTDADRGLAGLAYVSTWVGVNLPGTDAASAERIAGLVGRGTDAMPEPAAGAPDPDPNFVFQRP